MEQNNVTVTQCINATRSFLRSISQAMSQGRHKDTLKCPKDTGTCSVCWATFKIHRSTGHVHRHGHRDSPCPGSDKPPISAPLTQPSTDTTKRHTDTLSQTQKEQSPATSGRGSKLSHPSWVTLVNCIPRAARPSANRDPQDNNRKPQ